MDNTVKKTRKTHDDYLKRQIRVLERRVEQNKWNNYLLLFLILGITGAMVNLIVIVKNDGRMPVGGKGYDPEGHFYFNDWDDVNLPLFSDVIKVPGTYLSIGDLLIYAAAFGVVFCIFFSVSVSFKSKRKGLNTY